MNAHRDTPDWYKKNERKMRAYFLQDGPLDDEDEEEGEELPQNA